MKEKKIVDDKIAQFKARLARETAPDKEKAAATTVRSASEAP